MPNFIVMMKSYAKRVLRRTFAKQVGYHQSNKNT